VRASTVKKSDPDRNTIEEKKKMNCTFTDYLSLMKMNEKQKLKKRKIIILMVL
jgi:hypothetical protein